ncbi:hypothetical protein OG455_41580 [Kitasatospora sp. NBC_01287]|uniref:hypothetical protein n=1 Tax=Kitasatospora sp. NBC_01287 TaxID=2903573 RepID=UPI00225A9BFB|nr:hypothetical protein [Kitasatospora sp. NBC_01287]MCX4750976.1 hypothetical protein [Kitasatospora sp. NBC_01287]MCX4751773.1 hypothetical protein [Kitasatospora sp. NBC_01287]MCX4751935.1 hypothetical protein [Kitasatospora sp. NBC_01287]
MTTDPTVLAVQEARRTIYEALNTLPAWDAARVRAQLAELERAVEAHVREQVARGYEAGIVTWEGMGDRARDRNDMLRMAARIARNGVAQ